MKFLFKIICIALLGYLVQLFLPFWSLALVAFLVNIIIKTKGFAAFAAGFISGILLWSAKAYLIDMNTNSILTEKMAKIFSLSSPMLILVTGLVAALVTAFASLTGHQFNTLFERKRSDVYR
ncbi:MAG: hypothetical protein AAFX87_22935 [Bacteroidota bacterium]